MSTDRKPGPFLQKKSVLLLLALCLLLWADVAVSASDPTYWEALISSRPMLGETPVVTDFDGDNKPDIANAHLIGNQYRIFVYLSSRSDAVTLSSLVQLAGFKLLACDINKDSFQDLVVTTPSAPHALAVWLGDGRGGFRAADQERFDNQFGFTASPAYNTCSYPSQQDLLTEPSRPVCEKPMLAFADLCLEQTGFISCNAIVQPLRNRYFSLTSRSPPVAVLY